MYKRILIVLDEQPSTQNAIKHDVEMARAHRSNVIFLYVLPNYSFPMADVPAMAIASAEQFVHEAREAASKVLSAATSYAEASEVHSQPVMGSGADAAEYVAEAAKNRRCGLIVVATEGQNAVMRLLTGNIVPGLITKASIPVMACPGEASMV